MIRESFYIGISEVDLPCFADKVGQVRLKLGAVFGFDDNGILVECKDHG